MNLLHTSLAVTTVAAIALGGCKDDLRLTDTTQGQNESSPAAPLADNDLKKSAGSAVGTVDDAAITTRIKAAIILDPSLKSLDIKVNTAGGIVTLSGTADTPDKSERAAQIASSVDGVKYVNNQLNVRSSG